MTGIIFFANFEALIILPHKINTVNERTAHLGVSAKRGFSI